MFYFIVAVLNDLICRYTIIPTSDKRRNYPSAFFGRFGSTKFDVSLQGDFYLFRFLSAPSISCQLLVACCDFNLLFCSTQFQWRRRLKGEQIYILVVGWNLSLGIRYIGDNKLAANKALLFVDLGKNCLIDISWLLGI